MLARAGPVDNGHADSGMNPGHCLRERHVAGSSTAFSAQVPCLIVDFIGLDSVIGEELEGLLDGDPSYVGGAADEIGEERPSDPATIPPGYLGLAVYMALNGDQLAAGSPATPILSLLGHSITPLHSELDPVWWTPNTGGSGEGVTVPRTHPVYTAECRADAVRLYRQLGAAA